MSPHPRLRPVYLLLASLIVFAAACSSLPPVVPAPEVSVAAPTAIQPTAVAPTVAPQPTAIQASPAVTETAPIQGTAPLTDTTSAATPAPTPAMTAITGQVTYRQRIALAPDAIVVVELQDISRADAPATIVGKERIATNGQQVPIPFAIEYDLSQIDPAGLYSIRANIIEGGLITWLTANAPRVITRGAPTDQIEVIVQPSNNPQPAAPETARLEGTVTYRQRIALAPEAVIEVTLQDVSRADAPAILIASQTIEAQGQQPPIPFVLEYDPSVIDQRMTYTVSARITENGQLTWISTTQHPVLTRGAPTNNVEIIVEPIKR